MCQARTVCSKEEASVKTGTEVTAGKGAHTHTRIEVPWLNECVHGRERVEELAWSGLI